MEFWPSNMISTIYPIFFVIKANVQTVTLKETVRIFIYISKCYTYNVLNAWFFKDIFSKTNNAFSSDCCKNVYLGLRPYALLRQLVVTQFYISREYVSTVAASARTRRSLGHHLLHLQILWLLVIMKPADFKAQSSCSSID